jgi:hypothetical protein
MLCARSLAEENSICLALRHGMVHSIPVGGWFKIRGVLDLYINLELQLLVFRSYILGYFKKPGMG